MVFRISFIIFLAFFTGIAKAVLITQLPWVRENTQVIAVFKVDQLVKPQLFYLDKPLRVVMDLPHSTMKGYAPIVAFPIHRFRYATTPERVRLVFEMEGKTRVQYKWVKQKDFFQLHIIFMPLINNKIRDIKLEKSTSESVVSNNKKPIIKVEKVTLENSHTDSTVVEKNDNNYENNKENMMTPRSIRKAIVVIDPGHGGKDVGAIGRGGSQEKQVVFRIARELQMRINQEPGMHAVLTRNGDYFIALRERLRIARAQKADLFVAIHADAFRDDDAEGSSVYALSERGASSEAARWLAEKENFSELGDVLSQYKNPLLRSVLMDLSQTATINASLQLGTVLLRELKRLNHLHSHRVEQAPFVVLKSPEIPSVLIETGFITNPREEQHLQNKQHQQALATAMVAGIEQYFRQYPPRDTIFTQRSFKHSW